MSHDGSRLATGSSDGTSIYDTTADRLEHKLTGSDVAEALIFAPDRTVALDGTLSFDRRAAARIDWQRDPAAAARAWFRPQASSLALVSPDGPELADLRDPRSTRLFPNEATVTGVAVSLDGEFFATASVADVRVYSSRSGEELARIPGGGEQPRFGPAGDLLALQADDRVSLYRWQREALVEEACRRVVANLSCSEWERYVGSRDCRAICANLPPPERQAS